MGGRLTKSTITSAGEGALDRRRAGSAEKHDELQKSSGELHDEDD